MARRNATESKNFGTIAFSYEAQENNGLRIRAFFFWYRVGGLLKRLLVNQRKKHSVFT